MPETIFRHIACRQDDNILIIAFTDADFQGDQLADEVRRELLAALAQYGVSKMVLDFAAVRFLTSTAFRPLLSLHRKLQEQKGRMVFCNLSDNLAEVFVVTRLISTTRSSTAPFEQARDVADAVARLRHYIRRTDNGVLVLTLTDPKLHGDDLADSISAELMSVVTAANATKVALDFSRVEAITTPCMRPLLTLRRHLREHNGRVVICSLQPLVAEVLSVTRLISTGGAGPVPFETAPDVPAAVALLNS
jgi:anti-sigma B factor antagonist